jgi:glucose/arabinose dehydrogenase
MFRTGYAVSLAIVLAVAASSCGGSSPPPGTSNPPGGGSGDPVGSNARLGWNQTGNSLGEVTQMKFGAYVDNNPRVDLDGVQCGGSSSPFACSGRMPSMTPGSHTLELVAYVIENGRDVESGRSLPLQVTVTGTTASAEAPGAPANQQTTSDGVALRLDTVATGVQAVTALAFSRDGLVLIGERRGRIHVGPAANMRPGASLAEHPAAIELDDVHVSLPDTGGLLALALDPAFERTRFVYALYTAEARNGGWRFRIARFREAGGRLGERAVVFDGLPASPRHPAGALGFGADGKLYAAFDDGGNAQDAARPSSHNGKMVRLNSDGSTPQDLASPVFESDFRSPRGFDWHPRSGALWIADAVSADAETLRVRAIDARRSGPALRDSLRLPQATDAAAVAFARGTLMPVLEGDLFVASRQGRHLLRLRIDRRDPMRVVGSERLFAGAAGSFTAVASGPDGALYVGTDSAVLRIGPR